MDDAPDLEPSALEGPPEASNKIDTGSPLSGISRTITDQELSESSGARKLLLYAYDKLESECAQLRKVASRLHDCEKDLAANAVRLSNYKKMSDAGDLCKVVGGATLGFAANNIKENQWLIVGLLACVLIVGPYIYHYLHVKAEK